MTEDRPFAEGDIVHLKKDVLAWEWDTSEKRILKAGTEAEVMDVFPGWPAVEIEYHPDDEHEFHAGIEEEDLELVKKYR